MSDINTTTELPVTFYIADWYVDTSSNRIRLGDTERKLETKVMAVLVYLAARPGGLVTREELEQAVWHDTVVGYDALTNCITKLRKALEDSSRQPRYIETVSKKGYRLIAQVSNNVNKQTLPEKTVAQRLPKTVMFLGLLTVFAVSGLLLVWQYSKTDISDSIQEQITPPTIVVLPFNNYSQDSTQDYFSDGITVDISTELSKLSGLFVIDSSSAINYKANSIDATKVANELGVRYVLRGNFRRAGNKIRINVQLIDGLTGIHLWAEKYDREMKEIFDVQDDITAKIVNTLSIKLKKEEKHRIAHHYTSSIKAYEKFLQGQVLFVRNTKEDNLQAREMFEHAIDLDSGFARAYSALALTYAAAFRYQWSTEPDTTLTQALVFAKRAVKIDTELPQAYWVLGFVHLFKQNYIKSIETTTRAIELNPNSSDSYVTLAIGHSYNGNPEHSIRLIKKAMRLNPQYPAIYATSLGQAYYLNRQYEEAESALHDAIERNINLLPSHVYLIATLAQLNKAEEATWAITQLRLLSPDFSVKDVPAMLPLKDHEKLQKLIKRLQRAGL